ncbi:V-type ATPase subunit [Streptococcus didelphis]|uniref:V-type ATPase subunit n=1 Tax=Streptococcus didelphis TaxID=102886 RepID=A0ABY9LHQ0_9STRE|nr:V-type ATPase subunit [Streptococcus didelphis]WMB28385.1 V-type ATPase subunit [Streptococcus didelphis]WMB29070.1 V-type ATPase subunit [Streptococcus didelphis]
MDFSQFSQINTSISIKEKEFISPQQFEKILKADDKAFLTHLLQTSPYHLTIEDIEDLDKLEACLMNHLVKVYAWAFEESPSPEIVDLFSLRYTYHNLKVLLKMRATKKDLQSLLIPIGRANLATLENFVTSLKSDNLPEILVSEIQEIWEEYHYYQDIRVIEIGADLAYFKHLKAIAKDLDDPTFEKAVSMIIDLYNFITIKRAHAMQKSQGFIKQLIYEDAVFSGHQFGIREVEADLKNWFNSIRTDEFGFETIPFSDKIDQATITIVELEYVRDYLIFQLFDKARYTVEGPYPLARFLLGKEFEVQNLRLILSALANQLPRNLIKERMRPIYGQ